MAAFRYTDMSLKRYYVSLFGGHSPSPLGRDGVGHLITLPKVCEFYETAK